MSDHGIRGGQVWRQHGFPCHQRYVTLLGDGRFAMLSHLLDGPGSATCSTLDGRWAFSEAELREHFDRYGYTLAGQLYDLQYRADT